MRFAAALAATALSGFLYSLAFPPLSWQPFAWIALVPFFLALRGVGLGAALFLAGAWAVLASSFVADALPSSIETYFLQPKLASYALGIMVWVVTGSIYYMGFAPVYRAIASRGGALRPLLAGVAWAFFEMLRGRLLTGSELFIGNPWALSAYSQVGWHELVQVASVTGVYGISFLIGAVNAALAELVLRWWRHRRLAGRDLLVLVPAATCVFAVLGFGVVSLRGASEEAGGPTVPVAIVQGNLDLGSRWRSDFYGRNLDVYLELTLRASKSRPALVVWPEAALTFFLEDEPLYQRSIGRVTQAVDVQLLLGGPRQVEAPQGAQSATAAERARRAPGTSSPQPARRPSDAGKHYYNSVFLMEPSGQLAGSYDKQYLLPFAEYLPLRQLDFLRRRFERVRVFQRGGSGAPLTTRAGLAGILICNEAMLPEVARDRVLAGAEILVAPSNDSWIQDEKWADRMFDLVSLRAVEQRRYLIRASTSGPSAIVDPWGRVQVRSGLFSREIVEGRVRPRQQRSVYAWVGDAPTFMAGLLVAGIVLRERWARGAGRS